MTAAAAQLLLIFTFFSFFFTLKCSTTGRHLGGFSIQLIHRDSPLSPFYNPATTAEERWASMEELSLNRLRYIHAMADADVPSDSIQVPLVPGIAQYHMKLGIGTPPVDTWASVDTGSNLIWIQCQPCTSCYPQRAPIFDPAQSTTFSKVPCPSLACSNFFHNQCSTDGQCNYWYSYMDDSFTSGEAAADSFTVTIPEAGGNFPLPDFLFGCSHNSSDKFHLDEAGTVGLGPGAGGLSFIGQVGPSVDFKFSYCLSPWADKESGSQMMFGDKAVLSGDPTPMAVPLDQAPSFYYLNLDDISVGSNRLNIPPGTFRLTPDGAGGMIIDSGTSLTFLARVGYDMLVAELKRVVPLKTRDDTARFCFNGIAQDLLDGKVPTLTFHFEGLDVPLSPLSTFYPYHPGFLCAKFRSSDNEESIFGAFFQQNLNVGYDLADQKVYMAPADCPTF